MPELSDEIIGKNDSCLINDYFLKLKNYLKALNLEDSKQFIEITKSVTSTNCCSYLESIQDFIKTYNNSTNNQEKLVLSFPELRLTLEKKLKIQNHNEKWIQAYHTEKFSKVDQHKHLSKLYYEDSFI